VGTIALLTDFGDADGFVGVMKGEALKISSDATIVDITHNIESFDIRAAAFLLQKSVKHFPVGTTFVCVVDPGVGTERKIIAAAAGGYHFVAPDNGLLSYALSEFGDRKVVSIENHAYFAANLSHTFHGRDIMAPVGAHLNNGVNLREFGPALDSYQVLQLPSLLKHSGSVIGEIVYVDKFGNMISNINGDDLPSHHHLSELTCVVGANQQAVFCRSYAEAEELAATISGMGTVEIFLNQRRAADQFPKPVGTVVAVKR
jgi:S-adenosylmethionine hydrolase